MKSQRLPAAPTTLICLIFRSNQDRSIARPLMTLAMTEEARCRAVSCEATRNKKEAKRMSSLL